MRIYQSIDEFASTEYESTQVALGFFDGVHLGHRAVLEQCAHKGSPGVALTFRESPGAALGKAAKPLLTDNEQKAALMEALGIDAVIFADFLSIRDMSAQAFVRKVLKEKLRAQKVYCGYNYRFGKGGAGDAETLKALCREQDIDVQMTDAVYVDDEAVSSTKIRELLRQGDIEKANRMLGYRYAVSGAVGSGNHIGSALGFPTVNLPIRKELVVPRYGVYASRIVIDGREYKGATNIGVHPTVKRQKTPLCETFIIDYEGGELYGEYARCEPAAFIRDERTFRDIEELRKQVTEDIKAIRRLVY